MSVGRWLVGIDVGGTFTDVVACEPTSGRLVGFKVPSHSADPSVGFIVGLRRLSELEGANAETVIHATTIGTNAAIELRGAVTGLVTTKNFRDVLEIGRSARPNLYDLNHSGRPIALVPRQRRLEISERIAHDGAILVPLARDEIGALVQKLKELRVEAVAVCLLHSHTNQEHELQLKQALQPHFRYLTVSSEISAEYGEYERASTVVLNAYLMPTVANYLERLLDGVKILSPRSVIRVVQSNGGLMSVETAKGKPLLTALSGPAAGVTASQRLVRHLGLLDAVTLDMGGTSTDVCMIQGAEAVVTKERRVGEQNVRIPSLGIETIGAGGGSIASIDVVGALKVGPRSAGAQPGPCCYGLGGEECTVTDANLVLGYLNPKRVLGGAIRLRPDLSKKAITKLANTLHVGHLEMADGIAEVVNANMVRALRLVTVEKGIDIRKLALIAFGGAGPIHAGRLAQQLDIPRVIIPTFSSSFCALGCIASELRYETTQTLLTELATAQFDSMNSCLKELTEKILEQAKEDNVNVNELAIESGLDLRYLGQKHELEVPLPLHFDSRHIPVLGETFRTRHAQLYSYASNDAIQCVNVRVRGVLPRTEIPWLKQVVSPVHIPPTKRTAYFRETGAIQVSIFDRGGLAQEQQIAGPAIVEDEWSTVVVYPGQTLTVDAHGNLVIMLERLTGFERTVRTPEHVRG